MEYNIINLENVSLIYRRRRGLLKTVPVYAVTDVSLSLRRGEVLALVGESGCGKTSLGKVMIGLYKPTHGKVFYGPSAKAAPKDIWGMNRGEFKDFRQRAQIIHQDPYESLNPFKTVFQIVSAPLRYHKLVKGRHEAEKRVCELLEMTGLHPPRDLLNKYSHQLSGGQRQRVSIARALTLDPEIIVADEAVSMIDVSLRISILDLLLQFREKLGIAYVFISHDFGLTRYFAKEGRTAVMYLGSIAELGETEEVIRKPSHPYTRALLSAIPIPDPELAHSRKVMQLKSADIPSAENPPLGCKFHTRCPSATEKCAEETPELTKIGEDRYVACHLVE